MQSHGGGPPPMGSAQLHELQKMQRLQQQMQVQLRQQQQQTAPGQLLGSSSAGGLGSMSQGLMQQAQFCQQQNWSDPPQQSAAQGHRGSFTGMSNPALALMQQQQQQQQSSGGGMMGMGGTGSSNSQAAFYWNALQAGKSGDAGGAKNSMGMSMGMGSSASTGGSSAMQSLLSQHHGMGGQAMRSQSDSAMGQMQSAMGSSSSLGGMGLDSQPQLQAGNTSSQLLMQQQKMMADLKRQLHVQGTLGSNSTAGNAGMPTSLDRGISAPASLTGQRQALFQMQQRASSMSNVLGGSMQQDHSLGGSSLSQMSHSRDIAAGMQDRRSSFANTEPISVGQLSRRSSSASQASMGGNMYGGTGSSLLMQQQQQPAQYLANGGSDPQLLSQQQMMDSAGTMPMGQDLSQQPVSRSNSQLLGQPNDGRVMTEGSYHGSSDSGHKKRSSGTTSPSSSGKKKGKRRSSKKKSPPSRKSSGGDTSPGDYQSFLDGTFEGGWQSNADLPERRNVIFSIVKVIEQMRPDANKISKKLPQMAKQLEEHLYRSAQTKAEYLDQSTLKMRLHSVAQGLESSRSPSTGSGSQPSALEMLMGPGKDDQGEAEQRTQHLQQKLEEQLQHLQRLQRPSNNDFENLSLGRSTSGHVSDSSPLTSGSHVTYQSDQGDLQASTPQALSSASSGGSSSHPGILKTGTAKYQDPAVAQKKKVVRQQQQRLLLLRHASKCTAGAACKTKFCGQMVALWKHMKRCRDKKCKTAHCLSSRCVLNHYRICKSENLTSTCEVCAPVMRQIKMQQQGGDDATSLPQKDETRAQAAVASLPTRSSYSGSPSSADALAQQKRQQLEELQATQQKLQNQQMLLQQLKEQQAGLAEQQKQLRQQQQQVQPSTHQGQQLQQQQGLLHQLQQLFTQQQQLLQEELVRQSQSVQGGQEMSPSMPTSDYPTRDDSPKGGKRTSRRGSRKARQSTSKRSKASRGRAGGKGKTAASIETIFSESLDHDSVSASVDSQASPSPERAKRPADDISAGSGSVEERASKSSKIEVESSPESSSKKKKSKHGQQGDAKNTTSLIESMPIAAIEQHLESLNENMHRTPGTVTRKCLPLIQKLIKDQYGWVFRDRVDPDVLGLPDYFDVVKKPMHLSLVETNLNDGVYEDTDSFARDTKLVFENAILYNGEDSEVGEMAAIMLEQFEKDYSVLLKSLESHEGRKDGDDMCTLCGSHRLLFEPTMLFCSGACGMQKIRRNAKYYTDQTKQNHWCEACFSSLDEDAPIMLDDGTEVGKGSLQNFTNDAMPEEAWVQCDGCNGWVHQICALFNGRKNKNAAAYRCPKCHIDKARKGEHKEPEQLIRTAKDLDHCRMSDEIEVGLQKALGRAYEDRAAELGVDISEVEKVEGLSVRVISNMEKKHVVRDEMFQQYSKSGCPSEFPVRSKCIALFQNIHGVDVILFGMYVYEYGHSCPAPNRRRVYISYLDSVNYFQPSCYRTITYHAIIVEYLRYVKERGFHTAHIWSCPPSPGDDYIFYLHPKKQLIPRDDMLREWYHTILDKAKAEGIVLDVKTFYDEYFKNEGLHATSGQAVDPTYLPYFEGDYIPGEIENIIKDLREEDESKRGGTDEEVGFEPSKKIGKKQGTRSNPGNLVKVNQDRVMLRLGQAMYNMRENFMVAHLRSREFASAVEQGEDVSDWIEDGGEEVKMSSKRARISGKSSSVLFQPPPDNQQKDRANNKSGLSVASEFVTTSVSTVGDVKKEMQGDVQVDEATDHPGKESSKNVSGDQQNTGPAKIECTKDEEPSVTDDAPENRLTPPISNKSSANGTTEPVKTEASSANMTTEPSQGVSSEEKANRKTEEADGDPTKCVKQTEPKDEESSVATKSVKSTEPKDEESSVGTLGTVSVSVAVDQEELSTSYAADDEAKQPEEDIQGDRSVVAKSEAASVPDAAPKTEEEEKVADDLENTEVPGPSEAAADSSKRGFDEIEPTLSRHFASVRGCGKLIGSTADEDEPQEIEMFESRQQFLNYCQANHFQFDELRRAKHSTMMILFQLHNPSAPKFLQQCGACYRDITHGTRYHCNDCSNFDLCQDCYEPVTTGLWAKRDPRFTHDKSHSFAAIDMEAQDDTQKSRDERSRAIKMHLELLAHAGTCEGPPACSLNNCQRMKKLFDHVESCDVTYRNGCKICLRLLSLLTMHARMCTVRGSCPLPFCDRIRERNRRIRQQQQLMDDRRRQAQNDLYRNSSSTQSST